MVHTTACKRLDSDPAKIKAWIDATFSGTLHVVEIAIKGKSALVFIEYDTP